MKDQAKKSLEGLLKSVITGLPPDMADDVIDMAKDVGREAKKTVKGLLFLDDDDDSGWFW